MDYATFYIFNRCWHLHFITLPDVRSQCHVVCKIQALVGWAAAEGMRINYKEVINLPR